MKLFKFFGDKKLNLLNSDIIEVDGHSIPTNRIILAEQVHSNKIKIVGADQAGTGIISDPILDVDGLITYQKNIYIVIKTVDCIPIFLWNKKKEVVAALHSGRAGTEKNIVGVAIHKMMSEFSCNPHDIHVELGPAICRKCYPVNRETFENFVQQTGIEQDFPILDLKKVIISNLLKLRIPAENIINHQICTKEDNSYFSYRENQTTERQISIIGMSDD